MHWADRVIFNSKSVIPYSIKHEGVHPDQAVYIPNGVALDWGESDSKTSNFRGQFGLTEDTCIIGTIGRLNPQKGHSFLFKAFAKLQERYQNLALIIVGDGPLRQELEELAGKLNISNQVFFLGERSDIPVILSEINIYAHPSIFEGMPNAVMEAMVAGKPVVATEVDGIGELIQHGQTGVLVNVQSAEALEDGLSELIGNQGFRNQIAKAAALRMKKEFSVEKMVNSFDQLYRDRLGLKLSA
jgi:glycosyltransferase involved in cell wall biosynthesis